MNDIRSASIRSNTVALYADEISQKGNESWRELFKVPRPQLEAWQLSAARQRVEELVPRVSALKHQIDQKGIKRINVLDDLVPLLFNHGVSPATW